MKILCRNSNKSLKAAKKNFGKTHVRNLAWVFPFLPDIDPGDETECCCDIVLFWRWSDEALAVAVTDLLPAPGRRRADGFFRRLGVETTEELPFTGTYWLKHVSQNSHILEECQTQSKAVGTAMRSNSSRRLQQWPTIYIVWVSSQVSIMRIRISLNREEMKPDLKLWL